MKENKLTPEEVKKALECCVPDNDESCLNCPFDKYSLPECAEKLSKESIVLINRYEAERDTMLEDLQFRTNQVIEQQAEIERLENTLYDAEGVNLVNYWYQQCEIAENGCRNLEEDNKKLQSEIEQWKEEANRYQTLWCEDVQIAKSEAIKEFAERLEEKIFNCDLVYVYEHIDNLVKEMVGK